MHHGGSAGTGKRNLSNFFRVSSNGRTPVSEAANGSPTLSTRTIALWSNG